MKPNRRLAILGIAALALFAVWRVVSACGGACSGTPPYFLDTFEPDHPKEFRSGKLGVLRPGMSEEHLAIAWRHLKGLPVGPEDASGQQVPDEWVQEWDLREAMEAWLKVRDGYPELKQGAGEPPTIEPVSQSADYSSFFRILPPAFGTASRTLASRVKEHGGDQASLIEWLKGQDVVFSTTPAHPLIPRPVKAPAWLKADRDYQIACARFYSEQYAEARAAFGLIAKDKASPWQIWGNYLQARTHVREYTRTGGNIDHLNSAKAILEKLLDEPALNESVASAAEDYLDLIRIRLEPDAVQEEILADLSKPEVEEGLDQALHHLKEVRRHAGSDLVYPSKGLGLWLSVYTGESPAPATLHDDLKPDVPTLLVQLEGAKGDTEAVVKAWKDSERVAPRSPAQPTLRWLRLRHRLATALPGAHADIIEHALSTEAFPPWIVNRLRGDRRQWSRTLSDWLRWAPSKATAVEGEEGAESTGEGPELEESLAPGEAQFLDVNVPLDQLADSLRGGALKGTLADRIATAVWWRAVLLERWEVARGMQDLLGKDLSPRAAQAMEPADPQERRFRLARLALDFPGLSPKIPDGFGRGNDSHWLPLRNLSSCFDNWWCKPIHDEAGVHHLQRGEHAPAIPAFMAPADLATAKAEWEALAEVPSAHIWFGEVVLEFAKAHPKDPRVPAALKDVVAATKLPSCPDKEISDISRRCFQVLHRTYPHSPEAKATPYHY